MRVFSTFVMLTLIAWSAIASPPKIKFIENKGQWPDEVKYMADLAGGKVFFKNDGLVYSFFDTKKLVAMHEHDHASAGIAKAAYENGEDPTLINWHAVNVSFVDANCEPTITASNPSKTRYNYFLGNNVAASAAAFEHIEYKSVYDGIDVRFYKDNWLNYDIIISPEADPQQVVLAYEGADEMYLSGGSLFIKTSVNTIEEVRPYAYQVINGEKKEVACSYKLEDNKLSYELPLGYDPCYELIIDPALIFSTYSGSTADNWGNTATFDDESNLYSGGITNHYSGGTFPATAGAFQTSTQGLWDVAVLKFDSTGSDLIYATYLGGDNSEVPQSLIVDGNELIIMGVTGSSNYPTTAGAFDRSFNGGAYTEPFGSAGDNLFFSEGTDIFVTRLSANGASLNSSTFIGGAGNDGITTRSDELTRNYGDQSRGDVFVAANGDIVVASKTKSNDFPVLNAFQTSNAGGTTDAIVFSLANDLSQLRWSSYLGGVGMDAAYSIKEKSNGEYVVGGGTTSASINANFNNSYQGNTDGLIATISADGSQLVAGTFVGTNSYDQVYFVDLDLNDDIYSFGQSAGDFPVIGQVYSSGGGQFIQKQTGELDAVIWSTRFGAGSNLPDISPTAFLVNECNNIYISGWGGGTNNGYNGGSTSGLPVTSDAFQSSTSGSDFYLMTLDANASSLLYGTFLGGTSSNTHVDGGTSRFDKRGIVYHAVCAGCGGFSDDFPATDGAWSTTNNSPNCNNAAFKFDLASLRAVIQTNNTALNNPGFNNVCLPDSIVFQNLSLGGELFEWSFGDGTETSLTDTAYFAYQYEAPGEYTVVLRAIDPNTCTAEDVTSINVRVLDPIQETIDDQVICFGDGIELRAVGGTRYNWISADSSFSSNEASPVVSPEDSTLYIVRIADTFCESIDSLKVDVVPVTDFDFSIEKIHDCFSRPSVKLTNKLDGNYIWDLGDGNTSSEDELVYNYAQDGLYTVRLLGERGQCVFQEEVAINVATIKVPNVFTPADGEPNERFEIISSSRETLKIFSRWGDVVYESTDYQDDWEGSDVPAGVYYYEVIIEDETTCTGWVQIFK